jgi:hypothetical protein
VGKFEVLNLGKCGRFGRCCDEIPSGGQRGLRCKLSRQ